MILLLPLDCLNASPWTLTDILLLLSGVLGATGSVGQRFILLLALHPHFTLTAVGASPKSAGKKYRDAVKWKQSFPMTKELGELVVKECKADQFKDECDIVFSGLDSDVAGDTGKLLPIGHGQGQKEEDYMEPGL